MVKSPALDIITGSISQVQFLAQELTLERPANSRRRKNRRRGAAAAPAPRIVQSMRVFLAADGQTPERDVLLPGVTLGVHEGHQLLVVFGRASRLKAPLLMLVANTSTGQREERPEAIEAVMRPRPLFGPRWKALFLCVLMFLVGWFISEVIIPGGASGGESAAWALFFAILTYPVFWGLVEAFEAVRRGARSKSARRALTETLKARGVLGREPLQTPLKARAGG
jgi:hypothetical protein